jgi:hypothetical protein
MDVELEMLVVPGVYMATTNVVGIVKTFILLHPQMPHAAYLTVTMCCKIVTVFIRTLTSARAHARTHTHVQGFPSQYDDIYIYILSHATAFSHFLQANTRTGSNLKYATTAFSKRIDSWII